MLTDTYRSKLDDIVRQMQDEGQPDSEIQFVVNDYKGKYDVPEPPPLPKPKTPENLLTQIKLNNTPEANPPAGTSILDIANDIEERNPTVPQSVQLPRFSQMPAASTGIQQKPAVTTDQIQQQAYSPEEWQRMQQRSEINRVPLDVSVDGGELSPASESWRKPVVAAPKSPAPPLPTFPPSQPSTAAVSTTPPAVTPEILMPVSPNAPALALGKKYRPATPEELAQSALEQTAAPTPIDYAKISGKTIMKGFADLPKFVLDVSAGAAESNKDILDAIGYGKSPENWANKMAASSQQYAEDLKAQGKAIEDFWDTTPEEKMAIQKGGVTAGAIVGAAQLVPFLAGMKFSGGEQAAQKLLLGFANKYGTEGLAKAEPFFNKALTPENIQWLGGIIGSGTVGAVQGEATEGGIKGALKGAAGAAGTVGLFTTAGRFAEAAAKATKITSPVFDQIIKRGTQGLVGYGSAIAMGAEPTSPEAMSGGLLGVALPIGRTLSEKQKFASNMMNFVKGLNDGDYIYSWRNPNEKYYVQKNANGETELHNERGEVFVINPEKGTLQVAKGVRPNEVGPANTPPPSPTPTPSTVAELPAVPRIQIPAQVQTPRLPTPPSTGIHLPPAGTSELADFGLKSAADYWTLPDDQRGTVWPQLNPAVQEQLLSYEEPLNRPAMPAEPAAMPVVAPATPQPVAAPVAMPATGIKQEPAAPIAPARMTHEEFLGRPPMAVLKPSESAPMPMVEPATPQPVAAPGAMPTAGIKQEPAAPVAQEPAAPITQMTHEEFLGLPPERQKAVFNQMQRENQSNPVTGVPGQRAYNAAFNRATAKGTQKVTVAIADLNGLKEINDVLRSMKGGDDVLGAAYSFIAEQLPEASITKTHLHGDEYAVIAPGMTPDELQNRLSVAMQNLARENRIEHEGYIYRPTMSWAIGRAATADEVGTLNPKKVGKNAIGIDNGDEKGYTIMAGAPDVKPEEIITRGIHGENLRRRDLAGRAGTLERTGQGNLEGQTPGEVIHKRQGSITQQPGAGSQYNESLAGDEASRGIRPSAPSDAITPPAPPSAELRRTGASPKPQEPALPPTTRETPPAHFNLPGTERLKIDKLFHDGFAYITKVRRGKEDFYRFYDNIGNERMYRAADPHVEYIKENLPKYKGIERPAERTSPAFGDEQRREIDDLIGSGFKYFKQVTKKIGPNQKVRVWKLFNDAGQSRYYSPVTQKESVLYINERLHGKPPATEVPAVKTEPIPQEKPNVQQKEEGLQGQVKETVPPVLHSIAEGGKETIPPKQPAPEKTAPEEPAPAPKTAAEEAAAAKREKARQVFEDLQKKRAERDGAEPGSPMDEIRKKRDAALKRAADALKKLGKSFEERDPNTFYMAGTEQAQHAFDAVSALVEAGYYEFKAVALKVRELAKAFLDKKGFMEAIEDAYDAHAKVNENLRKRGDERMVEILDRESKKTTAESATATTTTESAGTSSPAAKPLSLERKLQLAEAIANHSKPTINDNSPGRIALREKIAEEFVTKEAAKKNHEAVIVIGLPASGKSRIADRLAKENGAIILDNDMIKKELPGYSNGWGAHAVHEESAHILEDRIMPKVLARGDDIVLPCLGKTLDNLKARIDLLKENGYTVTVVKVNIPVEVAKQRLLDRFDKTNRYVSPVGIEEKSLLIDKNYGILKEGKEPEVRYEEWDGRTGRRIEDRAGQNALGNEGGVAPGALETKPGYQRTGVSGGDEGIRRPADVGGNVPGEIAGGNTRYPGNENRLSSVTETGAENVATRGRKAGVEGRQPEVVPGTAEVGPVGTALEGEGRPGVGGGGEVGGRGNGLPPGEGTGAPGPVATAGEQRRVLPENNARDTAARDYTITDADNLGAGGAKQKFRDNISAIQTLKAIEAAGRLATPEEQAILVKYVGWGMFPHVFVKGEGVDPKWKKEAKELQGLLSPEEFEAANRSIINAHFSQITVIRGMWNALRRMGFNGGKVFEPAVGVGHFFGLRPSDLHYTMFGIDLDPLSGRIAKNLYQTSDIRTQGYETFPLLENHYDLFISNVPFADIKPFDRESKKYGIEPRSLSLHDFYFIKSLYGARPGGMVAFITSRYTMDKVDSSVRRKIAETADLIGAVRLPNTAFKGNAGTEVVTDILFLQKRQPGQPMSETTKDFLSLESIALKDKNGDEWSVNINKYYAGHPEMVIGKQSLEGSMYSDKEYTVYLNADRIGGQLEDALKTLPENILLSVDRNEKRMAADLETVYAPENVDVGSYFVKDGKVYSKLSPAGTARIADIPEKDVARTRALISFKNIFRQVFRNQLKSSGKPNEKDLQRLNNVYDAFVRRYGAVHDPKTGNVKIIDRDAGLSGLLALEKWDSETRTATKSSFLKGNLAVEREAEIKIESPQDAFLSSLAKTGNVNWPMMAESLGKTIPQIQAELLADKVIFLDHESLKDGAEVFVPKEEYLSGDVRKKLRDAREMAKKDDRLLRNVDALEKVQPPLKGPGQIVVGPNSPILDVKDISAFANKMFTHDESSGIISISHDSLSGKYTVSNGKKNSSKNTDTWGVNYSPEVVGGEGILAWNGSDIFDAVLNNSALTVRYNRGTADKPEFVVDEKATVVLREKAELLKDEFKRWVWRDPERAKRLVSVFNDVFNNVAERQYIHPMRVKNPDAPVKLFGGTFLLRANQADAVWRVLQSKNTMLAHGVGAGKTAIMAGAAMEMRRLGIRKKNLIVVPNHMIPQWQSEIQIQYPGARVLAATTTNFDDKTARREFLNKAAIGDYDIVLMRYSHYKMISVSPSIQTEFIRERMAQYKEALERIVENEDQAMQQNRGRRRSKTRAQKYLEKKILAMDARLNALIAMKKDTGFPYFDEMGFDQIFVDEADNFKNLDFASGIQNILGMGTPAGSEQALDMHMKVQFIQRQGGGVVFATGTPISNTLAEAYHMMRFLQPEELEKRNLGCFDEWQRMFAEPVTQWELNASGTGLKQRTRFSKFNNVQELARILRQVWDVMTSEMLEERGILRRGHELPLVKRQIIESNVTPLLSEYLDHLGDRERAIEGRKGPPKKGEDIHLAVISHGKLASIDMRLIHPSLPDEPGSKLNSVIDRVYRYYTDNPGTTGVIFYDMTRPRAKGEKMFDVYADIKKKLVAMGVPAKEIAFIHDFDTDIKKLQLFSDMNNAKVRILIGNTPKLGAGTNIQHKMKWEVHVDGPTRPRDVIQREGRIIRQGNENKEIVIGTAISKGSHDQSVWEMLVRKARMIDDILSGQDKSTDHYEEDDPFAEASIAAIGTPLMKQRAETKAEVKKLTALIENKQNEQYVARDKIEYNGNIISDFENKIELRTDVLKNAGEQPKGNQTRITTVDGKELTKREAANKYIVDWLKENKNYAWYRYKKAFQIGDIEVSIQVTSDERISLQLEGSPSPGNNIVSSVDIDGPSQPVLILSTVERFIWEKKGDIDWLKKRIGELKKENIDHDQVLKEDTADLGKQLDTQKSQLKKIEAAIAEESKKKAEEKAGKVGSGYDFYELEADRKTLASDKNDKTDEEAAAAAEKTAIDEAKARYAEEKAGPGPEVPPAPAMLKTETTPTGTKSLDDLQTATLGTVDHVLSMLPPGTGERLQVRFAPSFNVAGRLYGADGNWEMAVWYNPKSKVVELYINPAISVDRIATVLNHELPGHIGSRAVFADNLDIYKKMRAFFDQQKSSKEPSLMDIQQRYRDELEANPSLADDILFDEWTAHQLQRYLDEHARDSIATRIFNYFRGMLIKLGMIKEKIEDVLRAMVKKMRTANIDKAGTPAAKPEKESLLWARRAGLQLPGRGTLTKDSNLKLTPEQEKTNRQNEPPPAFLLPEETDGPQGAEREAWLETRRENAKHQVQVDEARAQELTAIKNRLGTTLRRLPPERMNDRADIELQLAGLEAERMDIVKSAIYSYARSLGLNGIPYNQVDTMLKNSRTPGDLKKAVKRLDIIWQAAERRQAVAKLYDIAEKKYKRLQKIKQGGIKSTLSAEANDRLEQYLNQLIKSPQENLDQINKLLTAFNYYGRKEAKSAELISDLHEDVKNWISDPTTDVPQSIKNSIKQLFAPAIEQMSLAETERSIADIESIETTGRTMKEIRDENIKREIETTAGTIAAQIEASTKKEAQTNLDQALEQKTKSKLTYFGDLIKEGFWGLIDPERMTEWLVGWKNSNLIKSIFLSPIYRAEATKIINTKKVLDRFQKIHEKIKIADTFNKSAMKITVERLNADGSVKDTKEYGLSLDNMMFIYANSRNEGNLSHLIGTGLTTDQINEITKALPQEYRDAVDEMIGYFDTEQYPRMNEIFRNEHEVDMPHVLNYFPIQNLKTDKAESAIVADYLARQGARMAATQKGMTKSRVFSKAPFKEMSYFGTVIRNLTQTEHYIAYNDAIRTLQRYLNTKSLKNAIQAKDETVYRQFRDWLKAVAYGRVSGSDNPLDKTADFFRNQFATYALGLKLTTGLQQLSSFTKGMTFINKGMALRSVSAFIKNPIAALEFANSKSPFMAVRMKNYERELSEMAERAVIKEATRTSGVLKKVKETAMWHIGAIDKAVATVLWNAKYEEVYHKTGDERSAIDAADEVIRKTQSRGGVVVMPSLYRGGGLVRGYTMFTSDVNQNLNQLFEMAGKWGLQKNSENAAQLFWFFILPTIMIYIINNAFHLDRPEEMVKTLINQFTQGIPFYGQMVDALVASGADKAKEIRGIIPNKNWKRWISDISPTSLQPILSVIDAAASLSPGKAWDALMQITGLPWNAVKRTINGVSDAWETKDVRYIFWSKYIVKDQSVRESMARREIHPRPGTDDEARLDDWYKNLDPIEKKEFNQYVNEYEKKIDKAKVARELKKEK